MIWTRHKPSHTKWTSPGTLFACRSLTKVPVLGKSVGVIEPFFLYFSSIANKAKDFDCDLAISVIRSSHSPLIWTGQICEGITGLPKTGITNTSSGDGSETEIFDFSLTDGVSLLSLASSV